MYHLGEFVGYWTSSSLIQRSMRLTWVSSPAEFRMILSYSVPEVPPARIMPEDVAHGPDPAGQ
jgi:hypothetical protein